MLSALQNTVSGNRASTYIYLTPSKPRWSRKKEMLIEVVALKVLVASNLTDTLCFKGPSVNNGGN